MGQQPAPCAFSVIDAEESAPRFATFSSEAACCLRVADSRWLRARFALSRELAISRFPDASRAFPDLRPAPSACCRCGVCMAFCCFVQGRLLPSSRGLEIPHSPMRVARQLALYCEESSVRDFCE